MKDNLLSDSHVLNNHILMRHVSISTGNAVSRFWLLTCFLIALIVIPITAGASNGTHPAESLTDLPTLLVLGDSLSASFGIDQSRGWVTLLQQNLNKNSYRITVVNASISGETTQGGLQRLPSLLEKYKPVLVIVELGGNDGLRGLQLSMIKSNLQNIIKAVEKTGASILLAGIRLPPNYGQVYTEQFYRIYVDIAKQKNIPLVPFILDGIATDDSLMQADGIHPTAEAQPIVLRNIWDKLKPALDRYRD